MKIAIAQLNYTVGDIEGNKTRIISAIESAKKLQADLVVFAELALCGYPPLDLLTYPSFIDRCEHALHEIATHCSTIAAILGSPTRNTGSRGKKLFNSACFLNEGELQFTQHKALLPDYDVFDEYRYFEPFSKPQLLTFKGHQIAIAICEDTWEVGEPSLYKEQPLESLSPLSADFLINIAASPYNTEQANDRKIVLKKNALKYNTPIYYVNQVGAQCDLIFDGGSLVCDENGAITHELNYFQEELVLIDHFNPILQEPIELYDSIEQALILGIKDFFKKQGFTKAVLGLSGGIDSALTAYLAVKALGPENVLGVLLPSKYSSEHSIADALHLVKNLGMNHEIISIENSNQTVVEALETLFAGTKIGVTEENLQARLRGTLLMAISNKFGYILLNTTNKSEAAVGYGTLYGDLCGGLAVLSDIYKTDVYGLSKWINKREEIIPWHTITKEPSAELRPDQKDSDSLPPYDVLDAILKQYLEQANSPEKIATIGFDRKTIDQVIALVNRNEYKRFQCAPGLRITKKAFGSGRKMPLVGKI